MIQRPIILKLFALFLFLDPFLRIIFLSIENDFTLLEIFMKTFTLPTFDMINFWLIFPLSGLLVLSVKLYSYCLFMLLQSYSLYFHLNYESYSWPYLAKNPSFSAYILLLINIFIVIYLLMPRSREVFFDKTLRWWERGSRYTINEPCFIRVLDQDIHGTVVDLSFGGALLKLDKNIDVGSYVQIDFDIMGKNVSLNAQVVRILRIENEIRHGIQFTFDSLLKKYKLKFLMFSISKVNNYEKYR